MQNIFNFLKSHGIYRLLSGEGWIYICFIGLIIQENSYKKYLLLMFLLVVGMYLLSGKIVRSIWLAFVGTFLLNKSFDIIVPSSLTEKIGGLGHDINFTFSIVLADVFLILVLYFLRFGKEKIFIKHSWNIRDGLLLGVLGCALFSTWRAAIYFDYAWYSLYVWMKYLVIFYLSLLVFADKEIVRRSLEIILIFCVFNSILVILQALHGGPLGWAVEDMYMTYGRYADELKGLYRPGGLSWNANLTSSIVAMMSPLVLIWSLTCIGIKQKVAKIFYGLMVLAILLMASRYVWLIFGVSSFLIYKIYGKKLEFKKTWYLLFLLLLVPFVAERMSSLSDTLGFQYRWNHILLSVEEVGKNPWGLGMDIFKYQIVKDYMPEKYFWDSTPPHNLFLEIFTGVGVIGGILYIGLIFIIFSDVIKVWQKMRLTDSYQQAIAISIVLYVILNQMYSSLYSVTITGLFWILLGMFYAKAD